MREASVVLVQVIIMFLIMVLGWILAKRDFIEDKAITTMNRLVIYVAGPSIMLKSFNVDFSTERMLEMAVAIVCSVAVMLIAIAIGRIFFRSTNRIAQYSVVFNNCGFIGIPLVQAVLGEEAVFYMTLFMAIWNLFAWTYGIQTLSGDRKFASWKNIVLNPATLAVFFGMFLFLMPFKLPAVLDTTLDYLGGMNTPLAMLVLGHSVAGISLKKIAADKAAWRISFFRLIVIPLVTLLFLMLLPSQFVEIKYTLLIAACTPIGAMLVMFMNMLDKNTARASGMVVLSTICSMVTIPVILGLASIVWTV